MSFMDKDHAVIGERMDSCYGEYDTGFKLTMLYVVGVEGGREGPLFKLSY